MSSESVCQDVAGWTWAVFTRVYLLFLWFVQCQSGIFWIPSYIACLVCLRVSLWFSYTIVWAPCRDVQPSLSLRKESYKITITNDILEQPLQVNEVYENVSCRRIVTDLIAVTLCLSFKTSEFWMLILWPELATSQHIQWFAIHHCHCECLTDIRLPFAVILSFYRLLVTWRTNWFKIQQLYVLSTQYFCVLYLSENKQRLLPHKK
jgi:hypothetical protein